MSAEKLQRLATLEAQEIVERYNDTSLPSSTPDEVMLIDVLLLCAECQQPIKARINTSQWIHVEWIGPSGECQACYQVKKEKRNVT